MNINVSVIGLDQVRKILEGAEKQMKYATMVALTRTAKHTLRLDRLLEVGELSNPDRTIFNWLIICWI